MAFHHYSMEEEEEWSEGYAMHQENHNYQLPGRQRRLHSESSPLIALPRRFLPPSPVHPAGHPDSSWSSDQDGRVFRGRLPPDQGKRRRRTESCGFVASDFSPQGCQRVHAMSERHVFDRKSSEYQLNSPKSDVEQRLVRNYSEYGHRRPRTLAKRVEKTYSMKQMSGRTGGNECTVCRGLLDARIPAVVCYECRRYACRKNCALEVFDSEQRSFYLCKLCRDEMKFQERKNSRGYIPQDRSPRARVCSAYDSSVGDHRAGPSDDPRRRGYPDERFERQRYSESGGPAMIQEYEDEYAPQTPQPRWAAAKVESTKRREQPRAARRSVSITHYYSSSEEEGSTTNDRVIEDDHAMESDDGSMNDGGVMNLAKDTRAAGAEATGRHSISVPCPTQPAQRTLQPPKPAFNQSVVDENGDLTVGAVAAASRRASLAAVERLVEKMEVEEVVKTEEIKVEETKVGKSNGQTTIQSKSPEVLSSPDDDHTCMGSVEFTILYDAQAQTLTVTVIKAMNLRARDKNGYSDPYVKLHLIPGSAKSTKLRTRTVTKTLNPEWNENLVYHGISEDERMKKTLRLLVLDEDRIGADFLGETRVPLKRLTSGKERTFSVYLESQLPLDKNDNQAEGRGKILVSLCYSLEKRALIVDIIRCAELIGMDPNGYSDPYVKIALLPETHKKHKAKTKTKKKTLNPVFEESFSLPVNLTDLQNKTLEITVWDKDVGKHDDYLGGAQLGPGCKGDREKHWYECIQNPCTRFQKWHKLSDEQFTHSNS